MEKQKACGKFPLISFHISPPLSVRITSQLLYIENICGRYMYLAIVLTLVQICATASGSSLLDFRPLFTGRQVSPPSSVRNAPAAEMATNMRLGLSGLRIMVWRHIPPAPGCQRSPLTPRSPESSCQVLPPSLVRKRPASSTPAYTTSGLVGDGSRCQTRLNSHGC